MKSSLPRPPHPPPTPRASSQLFFYNSLLQILTALWPTNKSRGRNKERVPRNEGVENTSDNQVLPVKPKFQPSEDLLWPSGPRGEGKITFWVLEEIS